MTAKQEFNAKKLEAMNCFDIYVEPILKAYWDYQLFRIEDINSDVSQKLDTYAGIDMFGLHKKHHIMHGISLRNQTGETNFRTFTIREQKDNGSINTELQKRIFAIKNSTLYPHYAIQSYVNLDNKKLLGFAIARTIDIIEKAIQPECDTRTGYSGQIFKVVKFDDLERYEYTPEMQFKKIKAGD